MKKIFLFAIAAVALTVGCQKNQITAPEVDPLDDGTPVPVVFGTNVATVSTKAAVDEIDDLETQTIYVYGIDNESKVALVNNCPVTTPLSKTNSLKRVKDGEDEYYYYGIDGETYNFYGYYIGTALTPEKTVTYSDGVITVPVTIDGTQDLMVGLTNKVSDIANKDKDKEGNVTENDLYSAKSARRGVTPNLVFNHKLVRFDFEFDGSSIADDKTVTVESVSVKTHKTGNLVITHGTTPSAVLTPTDTEESDITAGSATNPIITFANGTGTMAAGAGTIMVMPKSDTDTQQSYAVTLKLKQGEGAAVSQNLTLAMPTGKSFEAGKKYAVVIKVYGMEAVIVDVTVKEWGEGGTFEYDPDEDETPVYIPVMGNGETITFDATESSQSFMFDAEGHTWTIDSNSDWLTVDPAEQIKANCKVTFTASANDGVERTAIVTFKAEDGVTNKTVKVTQSAPAAEPAE